MSRRKLILSIVGARPQFVKAAALSKSLATSSIFSEHLLHTGQHYDQNMSDIFFQELDIRRPDTHLKIASSKHGAQTAEMIKGIEEKIEELKPDLLLVYGDTNSTLAGALAASKLHIPIIHVESGLRSYNRKMPEEINRVLTDQLSELLFCSSELGKKNLLLEGVSASKISVVGDVMYDVCRIFGEAASDRSTILGRLELEPRSYVLATLHRAENVDQIDILRSLTDAMAKIAEFSRVVLPLHPRAKKRLSEFKLHLSDRIICIEPVGLLDMFQLEKNAKCIVTDSGGVQKEAFFFRVPCITVRTETEWKELVEMGWNSLIAPGKTEALVEAVKSIKSPKGPTAEPYGNSHSCGQMLQEMSHRFG